MRTIETYEGLEAHVKSWKEGHIRFLAIVGPPGLGKSTIYEILMKNVPHNIFKGRNSAVEIYKAVYDNPDVAIIFDDVGALLKDQSSLDLMKSMCDSREERLVQWRTSRNLDGRRKHFKCTAPVLLICNRTVAERNDDVKAVLDRADVIEFDPPKAEVIKKLKSYATNQHIVDMMERLDVIPSLRTYEKALGWEASPHLDLTDQLLNECGIPAHIRTLVKILADNPKMQQKPLAKLYNDATGRTERQFYRDKKTAGQFLNNNPVDPTLNNGEGI